MIVYLTSSPCRFSGPGEYEGGVLNEKNHFLENLQKDWPADARALMIASDPEASEQTEGAAASMREMFAQAGLEMKEQRILDERTARQTQELLQKSNVVFLCGGHVPTQNAFFQKISLRQEIASFSGIVIGISAGSMNSARVVYAQPELEGEAADPAFERFLPGLSLTEAMIVPHYDKIREDVLDGLRVIEDITCADSQGRCFYLLPDGSYLRIADGKTVLYGECFLARDGRILPFCAQGARKELVSPGS